MTQPDQNETMTIRQVAAYLHVSKDTVHRLIKAGHLRAYKKTPALTSAYLVDRGSVLAFDSFRRQSAEPPTGAAR